MLNLSEFFHTGPIPLEAMSGSYSWHLVGLSYVMAAFASLIALDIAEKIRANQYGLKKLWLVAGAVAMGTGIWTMHFIGMLAFRMPMSMDYHPGWTGLSLVIAIVASGCAFLLIRNKVVSPAALIAGGVILGLGIAIMHYMGMSAMQGVKIRYHPHLFTISVFFAIAASEAALWLMIKGTETTGKLRPWIKLGSSLIMGLAICGMHYTGMAAAVFTMVHAEEPSFSFLSIDPNTLSISIAGTTLVITAIALLASRSWMKALQSKNEQLMEAKSILAEKSRELEKLVEVSHAREVKVRAILTAAADGIIVLDDAGCIELCNKAAGDIFGYDELDLLGRNMSTLLTQYDRELNFDRPVPLSALTSLEQLTEYTGVHSSGKNMPIELTVSKSEIGGATVHIIVLRDITERKRAEENLNNLNNKLVGTARLAGMTEVAAGVLHNIGNVLNSINVTSQLLLERDGGDKVRGLVELSGQLMEHRENLDVFLNSHPIGQHLAEYIAQFAEYWENEQRTIQQEIRSLNGKVEHIKSIVAMQQSLCANANVIEKVSLNTLIEDALDISNDEIKRRHITIVKEYAKIPQIEVDRIKVLQVLINLIKNAVEALTDYPAEGKTIHIKAAMKGKEFVRIEITDNGIGIRQENLTRIFSYGFTTKAQGHGFGLHACALAVQQSGGSLTAHSDGELRGSTFILTIPTQEVECYV